MPQTGSLAANFHEGSRSEYLAQYALSSLGMAALLPRQEDVGIDLQCALGERIGQRLLIDRYYLVQVKSTDDFGAYEGVDSVKWLCAHRHPLFMVRVTKRNNLIDIYQTAELVQLAKLNAKKIRLVPGGQVSSFSARHGNQDEVLIELGPPILSFDVSMSSDEEWRATAKKVLQSWIDLDQRNIDRRVQGLTMFEFPLIYQTNNPPEVQIATGNFKNASIASNLFDTLAICVHQAASEKDVQAFKDLAAFTMAYAMPKLVGKVPFSLAMHLTAAINTAAQHLEQDVRLSVKNPDGSVTVPNLKIEGN